MEFKEFLNERTTHTPLPVIDPRQRKKPGVQRQLAKKSAAAVARSIPNQDLVKLQHAGLVNASRTYYLTKAGVKFIEESRSGRQYPKRGIKYTRAKEAAEKSKPPTPYEQGWKRAGEHIQQLTGQPPRSSDTPPRGQA